MPLFLLPRRYRAAVTPGFQVPKQFSSTVPVLVTVALQRGFASEVKN